MLQPTRTPPRRGRRTLEDGPALDRDRLIAVLMTIARAEGVEAINMRRVAADLNVSPRLLYHHVRDKDEMIDILSDAITGHNMPDFSDPDWEVRLRKAVASSRAAFADFPGVPASILGRSVSRISQPHAAEGRAGLLQALRDAGLSPENVQIAYVQFAVMLMGGLVLMEDLASSNDGALEFDRACVQRSLDMGVDLLMFGIKRLVREQAADSDPRAAE